MSAITERQNIRMETSAATQRQAIRTDSLNLSFFWTDEKENIIVEGMGRTLNMSATGILLETFKQIPQDTTVHMEIAIENDIITASGIVIHTTKSKEDTFLIGMQFTTLSDEDKKTLNKYIE